MAKIAQGRDANVALRSAAWAAWDVENHLILRATEAETAMWAADFIAGDG